MACTLHSLLLPSFAILAPAIFAPYAAAATVNAAPSPRPLPRFGDIAPIPAWNVSPECYPEFDRSKAIVKDCAIGNVTELSSPDYDASSWLVLPSSRGTLMATLLENNIWANGRPSDPDYTDLFRGDYMVTPPPTGTFSPELFEVPWYYRTVIKLRAENFAGPTSQKAHTLLHTHGITSRADIFVNGRLVAGKKTQAGAYAGQTYDISQFLDREVVDDNNNNVDTLNVLLIKVYPTDPMRDLAIGFVDWNPMPMDNGTGIWRDVELSTRGPLAMSKPRVVTKVSRESIKTSNVSIHVNVRNNAKDEINGWVECFVLCPNNHSPTPGRNHRTPLRLENPNGPGANHQDNYVGTGSPIGQSLIKRFTAAGNAEIKLTLPEMKINDPQLWWPKQWGDQPLYSVSCNLWSRTGTPPDDELSARSHTTFGIREVRSELNKHNDTQFFVNHRPFQVLGAGYTSDIFLRFNETKVRAQLLYSLDMGLNTIRLEGKQEHPALYRLADELGLMLMAGWECCDKWEGWSYNDESNADKWAPEDYEIAERSMRHEAGMMMSHPSMLGFLVGSDFWPDDRATAIYVDALKAYDWDTPIISSASQRGFPKQLGNGGMKMAGPYEYVPPVYWHLDELGGAFGFASELSAGTGTPELTSLKWFLDQSQLDDLWKTPNKTWKSHMGTSDIFNNRRIFNDALWNRYGAPKSLEDYVLKAQMMTYETVKAQFEAYASHWSAARPATGLIYWMLNSAWPSLHWNLFDYYLRPHAGYFATKRALQMENVVFDYASKSAWIINRDLHKTAKRRSVQVDFLTLTGKALTDLPDALASHDVEPNSSKLADRISLPDVDEVVLMKLILLDGTHGSMKEVTTNVYWLNPKQGDVMDFGNPEDPRESDWYYTPVSSYANLTSLSTAPEANVTVTVTNTDGMLPSVALHNASPYPAIFIHLDLQSTNPCDPTSDTMLPVMWSDNYFTLWPGEKKTVKVTRITSGVDLEDKNEWRIAVRGANVPGSTITSKGVTSQAPGDDECGLNS